MKSKPPTVIWLVVFHPNLILLIKRPKGRFFHTHPAPGPSTPTRPAADNRNVFEQVFGEIKYLCRAATAGSREARKLEKVKKAFGEAQVKSAAYDPAITAMKNSKAWGDLLEDIGVEESRAWGKVDDSLFRYSQIASHKKKISSESVPAYAGPAAGDWDSTVGSQSWSEMKREAMYSDEYGTVDKQYETASLYDKDGERLFLKKGKSFSVEFISAEIKQMRNGVLTHNHPGGGCFSPADINMLRRGKLSEVRAVTPQGVYRLQKPAKWSSDISSLAKIDAVYYDIDNQVSPAIYAKAAHGDITYAQADAMSQEAVLREFANRYGLGFAFDSWDEIRRKI